MIESKILVSERSCMRLVVSARLKDLYLGQDVAAQAVMRELNLDYPPLAVLQIYKSRVGTTYHSIATVDVHLERNEIPSRKKCARLTRYKSLVVILCPAVRINKIIGVASEDYVRNSTSPPGDAKKFRSPPLGCAPRNATVLLRAPRRIECRL